MERIIRTTRNKFIATFVLVVVFVVGISWGILQVYNQREIASPADITEIHDAAGHNKDFSQYLDDQKEYEAHFITLASSIKEQEAARVTRGLALTTVVVVSLGVIVALLAVRRLMKPVVEAYESQERFVQDAAHELRNPLAAMTAALQQTKEQSPLVTTFRRQTKRLIHINEDLLFLERRSKQTPTSLDLSELLQDVIEELQPLAVKNKITLDLTASDKVMKTMVSSDYVRLVKNIIDNAVKYSNPISTVTISQTLSKGSIKLVVKDNGIGIPADDLTNIGSRFFRASNTGKVNGTGLGLANVQKILNSYGGNKIIASTPEKGTTVTINLPT